MDCRRSAFRLGSGSGGRTVNMFVNISPFVSPGNAEGIVPINTARQANPIRFRLLRARSLSPPMASQLPRNGPPHPPPDAPYLASGRSGLGKALACAARMASQGHRILFNLAFRRLMSKAHNADASPARNIEARSFPASAGVSPNRVHDHSQPTHSGRFPCSQLALWERWTDTLCQRGARAWLARNTFLELFSPCWPIRPPH